MVQDKIFGVRFPSSFWDIGLQKGHFDPKFNVEFEHLDQKYFGRPTLFIWDLNLVAERNLNPQDIAHYATR